MNNKKAVFTTHDLTEAHMVLGLLEPQGLATCIEDENIN